MPEESTVTTIDPAIAAAATASAAANAAPAVIAAVKSYPFDITLPSGKVATITRKMKGRDMVQAEQVVPDDKAKMARSFAMIAPVVKIDGKQLVMEDFLEFEFDDIADIVEAAQGNSPSSTQKD